MIAMVLEIVIAVALSFYILNFAWWTPVVSFPLIMSLGNSSVGRLAIHPLENLLMTLLMLVWTVAVAVVFYGRFDAWWAIPIGLVIGFFGAVFTAPKCYWQWS